MSPLANSTDVHTPPHDSDAIDISPPTLGNREEPADWAYDYFQEDDTSPHIVTKRRVLWVAARATLPQKCDLSVALAAHPDLRRLRAELIDAGDEPALLEGVASELRSIFPAEVQEWPFWYVRLPADWSSSMQALVESPSFFSYSDQHPRNPWFLPWWLGISTNYEFGERFNGRHIRVNHESLSLTFRQAENVNGVIVFYECAEELFLTVYPMNYFLFFGAFEGNALNWYTRARLQAQCRALAESNASSQDPGVLTLKVAELVARREEKDTDEASLQVALQAPPLAPASAREVAQLDGLDAAIGVLSTISDYIPSIKSFESNQIVVKLPVPNEIFNTACVGQAGVQVALSYHGDALDSIYVLVGKNVMVAEFGAHDADVVAAVAELRRQSKSLLVLENERNGYLHEIDLTDNLRLGSRDPTDMDAYADETGEDVVVRTSRVLSARAWQERELEMAEARIGPAGGLRKLPGVADPRPLV